MKEQKDKNMKFAHQLICRYNQEKIENFEEKKKTYRKNWDQNLKNPALVKHLVICMFYIIFKIEKGILIFSILSLNLYLF